MRRSCRPVFAAVLLTTLAATTARGADPHPEKAIYADSASWPAVVPGEVTLTGFQPFHAVYDRTYTQGSGPGAGEKRKDRVIVHADEVAWDGRRAVAITVLDSGAAEHADTNMRALVMVVALDDLSVLFEIGPAPGKAKDYYLARVSGREMLLSMVDTAAQKLQPKKVPIPRSGFGPGSWVMASMALAEGRKIQLAPYYSPQANPISQSSYGRVIGRREITDGSGAAHQAWVVETPGWYRLDHPKVLRLYLKNTPPYYLGTETYHHDSAETSRFVWLREMRATGE